MVCVKKEGISFILVFCLFLIGNCMCLWDELNEMQIHSQSDLPLSQSESFKKNEVSHKFEDNSRGANFYVTPTLKSFSDIFDAKPELMVLVRKSARNAIKEATKVPMNRIFDLVSKDSGIRKRTTRAIRDETTATTSKPKFTVRVKRKNLKTKNFLPKQIRRIQVRSKNNVLARPHLKTPFVTPLPKLVKGEDKDVLVTVSLRKKLRRKQHLKTPFVTPLPPTANYPAPPQRMETISERSYSYDPPPPGTERLTYGDTLSTERSRHFFDNDKFLADIDAPSVSYQTMTIDDNDSNKKVYEILEKRKQKYKETDSLNNYDKFPSKLPVKPSLTFYDAPSTTKVEHNTQPSYLSIDETYGSPQEMPLSSYNSRGSSKQKSVSGYASTPSIEPENESYGSPQDKHLSSYNSPALRKQESGFRYATVPSNEPVNKSYKRPKDRIVPSYDSPVSGTQESGSRYASIPINEHVSESYGSPQDKILSSYKSSGTEKQEVVSMYENVPSIKPLKESYGSPKDKLLPTYKSPALSKQEPVSSYASVPSIESVNDSYGSSQDKLLPTYKYPASSKQEPLSTCASVPSIEPVNESYGSPKDKLLPTYKSPALSKQEAVSMYASVPSIESVNDSYESSQDKLFLNYKSPASSKQEPLSTYESVPSIEHVNESYGSPQDKILPTSKSPSSSKQEPLSTYARVPNIEPVNESYGSPQDKILPTYKSPASSKQEPASTHTNVPIIEPLNESYGSPQDKILSSHKSPATDKQEPVSTYTNAPSTPYEFSIKSTVAYESPASQSQAITSNSYKVPLSATTVDNIKKTSPISYQPPTLPISYESSTKASQTSISTIYESPLDPVSVETLSSSTYEAPLVTETNSNPFGEHKSKTEQVQQKPFTTTSTSVLPQYTSLSYVPSSSYIPGSSSSNKGKRIKSTNIVTTEGNFPQYDTLSPATKSFSAPHIPSEKKQTGSNTVIPTYSDPSPGSSSNLDAVSNGAVSTSKLFPLYENSRTHIKSKATYSSPPLIVNANDILNLSDYNQQSLKSASIGSGDSYGTSQGNIITSESTTSTIKNPFTTFSKPIASYITGERSQPTMTVRAPAASTTTTYSTNTYSSNNRARNVLTKSFQNSESSISSKSKSKKSGKTSGNINQSINLHVNVILSEDKAKSTGSPQDKKESSYGLKAEVNKFEKAPSISYSPTVSPHINSSFLSTMPKPPVSYVNSQESIHNSVPIKSSTYKSSVQSNDAYDVSTLSQYHSETKNEDVKNLKFLVSELRRLRKMNKKNRKHKPIEKPKTHHYKIPSPIHSSYRYRSTQSPQYEEKFGNTYAATTASYAHDLEIQNEPSYTQYTSNHGIYANPASSYDAPYHSRTSYDATSSSYSYKTVTPSSYTSVVAHTTPKKTHNPPTKAYKQLPLHDHKSFFDLYDVSHHHSIHSEKHSNNYEHWKREEKDNAEEYIRRKKSQGAEHRIRDETIYYGDRIRQNKENSRQRTMAAPQVTSQRNKEMRPTTTNSYRNHQKKIYDNFKKYQEHENIAPEKLHPNKETYEEVVKHEKTNAAKYDPDQNYRNDRQKQIYDSFRNYRQHENISPERLHPEQETYEKGKYGVNNAPRYPTDPNYRSNRQNKMHDSFKTHQQHENYNENTTPKSLYSGHEAYDKGTQVTTEHQISNVPRYDQYYYDHNERHQESYNPIDDKPYVRIKDPESFFDINHDLLPDLATLAKPKNWNVRDFSGWKTLFDKYSSHPDTKRQYDAGYSSYYDSPTSEPNYGHHNHDYSSHSYPRSNYGASYPTLENPFSGEIPNIGLRESHPLKSATFDELIGHKARRNLPVSIVFGRRHDDADEALIYSDEEPLEEEPITKKFDIQYRDWLGKFGVGTGKDVPKKRHLNQEENQDNLVVLKSTLWAILNRRMNEFKSYKISENHSSPPSPNKVSKESATINKRSSMLKPTFDAIHDITGTILGLR